MKTELNILVPRYLDLAACRFPKRINGLCFAFNVIEVDVTKFILIIVTKP